MCILVGAFLIELCIELAPEETLQALLPFGWCQDALEVWCEVAEHSNDVVCQSLTFLVTEPVGHDLQIDFFRSRWASLIFFRKMPMRRWMQN